MRPIHWQDYIDELDGMMSIDEAVSQTVNAFQPHLEAETVEAYLARSYALAAEMSTADRLTRGAEGGWCDL